ncbi:MAG: serine--tRNA ligase [Rhodothermales bacterium]|nr:serine--tRNA ligase [Rhodothermales bacterium]
MLDLQFVRQHPNRVRQAIRDKGTADPALVDRLLDIDERRRAAVTAHQEAQTALNAKSKTIGELMRAGRRDEAEAVKAETSRLKERVKELEDAPKRLEDEQRRLLLEIPNVPHESVPVGHSESENEVAAEVGERITFSFNALPHWELAERHGLIDFERGAKVTGAGFPFYVGQGARLQRALIQFFLDLAVEEGGYTEMQPPFVVNEESGIGTGQLPDKEDLMYEVQRDALYLIPTAEVPVTNYFRDEVLDAADLPAKFVAYTPCFRREAGSYGKDVRGLNRLHQFDKVELVQFVRPDESYDALESLLADAERAVERLGLPYRRLLMCTGDMGFTQAKKYDLEVWSAGQERWLEVSSVSNFEAYQARRANVRFRPAGGGKPEFVHTLNGSGLALPRIVAALLENYQQADGTVTIPEPLRPYTGFDRIG